MSPEAGRFGAFSLNPLLEDDVWTELWMQFGQELLTSQRDVMRSPHLQFRRKATTKLRIGLQPALKTSGSELSRATHGHVMARLDPAPPWPWSDVRGCWASPGPRSARPSRSPWTKTLRTARTAF